jgi:hypothetical protein
MRYGKGPLRWRIGRTRVRLAEMLTALGYTARPEDLRPQYGAWRTDHRLDVCRWEGTVLGLDGMTKMIQSWDTMTACVRRGIEVTPDERNSLYIDVSAKDDAAGGAAGGV